MEAIATIKEKLDFLIDLSIEERKALPKMGDKSRAFVRNLFAAVIGCWLLKQEICCLNTDHSLLK